MKTRLGSLDTEQTHLGPLTSIVTKPQRDRLGTVVLIQKYGHKQPLGALPLPNGPAIAITAARRSSLRDGALDLDPGAHVIHLANAEVPQRSLALGRQAGRLRRAEDETAAHGPRGVCGEGIAACVTEVWEPGDEVEGRLGEGSGGHFQREGSEGSPVGGGIWRLQTLGWALGWALGWSGEGCG